MGTKSAEWFHTELEFLNLDYLKEGLRYIWKFVLMSTKITKFRTVWTLVEVRLLLECRTDVVLDILTYEYENYQNALNLKQFGFG